MQTLVAQGREVHAGQVTEEQIAIDRVKLTATTTFVTAVPLGTRSISGEDIGGRHKSVYLLSCRAGSDGGMRRGSAPVTGGVALKHDNSGSDSRQRPDSPNIARRAPRPGRHKLVLPNREKRVRGRRSFKRPVDQVGRPIYPVGICPTARATLALSLADVDWVLALDRDSSALYLGQ